MKMLYLMLTVLTLLIISCGSEPSEDKSCSPSCKSWEECIDGTCNLKDNSCIKDTDCNVGDICNLSTNLCELSACNPKCEGWEECNASDGSCKIKEGRCGEESLCTNPAKPVCSEQHYCIEASNNCIKACDNDNDCDNDDICDTSNPSASQFYCLSTSACDNSWQYCYQATCETRQGFCDESTPCTTIDLPLCDTDTHLCMPQETGCGTNCESWQICNADKLCATAPGFCAVNADCLISPTRPICDLENHVCASEQINFLQPVNLNVKSLIITNEQFKNKFKELARIHNLTGTPVDIITIEEICDTRTCNSAPKTDTAAAIKSYLTSRTDIKYVVLGGDIEIVPSREVHDKYYKDIAGYYTVNVEEDFYTDYYYADLANWDTNNNGIYAENNGDNLGDYRPELAVSRLSVSTEAELDNYIKKLKIYMFDYDPDSVEYALLLTNVATTVDAFGQTIPIDAAQYFEMDNKTTDIIENNSVGANINFLKLYNSSSSDWDSKKLQCDGDNCNIRWAIEGSGPDREFGDGNPNLVVHMGHGGVHTLMVEQTGGENEFSGQMAYDLENDIPNILLSCACQAGTFSANDSAGEMLVNAPKGGSIIYLGDSSIGLGLAGGAQLIDEFIKYFYNNKNIIIGDAVFAAHKNMPLSDILDLPVLGTTIPIDALDKDSYEWTQKVATVLGDLLIPVWNTNREFYSHISITQGNLSQFPNASDLSITANSRFPDKTYMTILTDTGNYYEIDLSLQNGVLKEINEKPAYIYYGIRSETAFYAYDRIDF